MRTESRIEMQAGFGTLRAGFIEGLAASAAAWSALIPATEEIPVMQPKLHDPPPAREHLAGFVTGCSPRPYR